MACGTPVMAWSCGAMPEVVDHGVNGILVESMEDAVTTMPDLLSLDRRRVRATFEERFSASRMARDYVTAYQQLIGTPTETRDRADGRNLLGAIH
jgi:glycosyltransferase involved in cell wall biosynthesis